MFRNVIIFISFFCLTVYGQTTFTFTNEPIDVVIPCVEKDLSTLDLCIEGIKKNGANIRRVIVISKTKLTKRAEWVSEDAYPFSFDDVARALANGNPSIEAKLLLKKSRTGWYFQQLLKLYAPLVIPDISENVLVLDADTIFLNPVTFLNEQHAGLYNTGIEYRPHYFHHGELLIPGFKKLYPEYSGITHHMIFQRPVILALFSVVETYHQKPFWQAFCSFVQQADPKLFAGASEYEIYFNYVLSKTDQTAIRILKWKNVTKFSDIPKYKKKGYHYISIHDYKRKE